MAAEGSDRLGAQEDGAARESPSGDKPVKESIDAEVNLPAVLPSYGAEPFARADLPVDDLALPHRKAAAQATGLPNFAAPPAEFIESSSLLTIGRHVFLEELNPIDGRPLTVAPRNCGQGAKDGTALTEFAGIPGFVFTPTVAVDGSSVTLECAILRRPS